MSDSSSSWRWWRGENWIAIWFHWMIASSRHLHQSFLCPVLSCNWFFDGHESLAQTRLTDYYSISCILWTDSSSQRIPVLLLITGDSLLFGSGNLFDPSLLSFHENIMVITANFRLGLFGEYCLNFPHVKSCSERVRWFHAHYKRPLDSSLDLTTKREERLLNQSRVRPLLSVL